MQRRKRIIVGTVTLTILAGCSESTAPATAWYDAKWRAVRANDAALPFKYTGGFESRLDSMSVTAFGYSSTAGFAKYGERRSLVNGEWIADNIARWVDLTVWGEDSLRVRGHYNGVDPFVEVTLVRKGDTLVSRPVFGNAVYKFVRQ